MRGGNRYTHDARLLFVLSQIYQRIIETSYYLQPTLGDVDVILCDLAKLPKPSSGCLTKKQWSELRQWTQWYGRSVRQNTTRNVSMRDKPGTLPLNLYEFAPPEQHSVDFEVLLRYQHKT